MSVSATTSSATTEFVRLRASGRDRAKFLHNFCTNNIKDLAVGTACEAFFTDVKARILAHGYVLALEHVHEIWLLPGDPEALLKHLTRYIITEDVTIERVTPPSATMVICCAPLALSAVRSELPGVPDQPLRCCFESFIVEDRPSIDITSLCFAWADRPMIAISSLPDFLQPFTARLAEKCIIPISPVEFDQRRIEERFPLVGQDVFSENLAPEAERNAAAISYKKGCYLGQEPIARLDAMGHVNRALRIVEMESSCSPDVIVGLSLRTSEGTAIGTITSACRVSSSVLQGLAMVRSASPADRLHVILSSDDRLTARVLPL